MFNKNVSRARGQKAVDGFQRPFIDQPALLDILEIQVYQANNQNNTTTR